MSIENSYKLKTAFDSLATDYKTSTLLTEKHVSLMLNRQLTKPVIEMPPLPVISSAQMAQTVKNTMDILSVPVPKKTQNELLEELDTIKIKNLILTEQIKGNKLLEENKKLENNQKIQKK